MWNRFTSNKCRVHPKSDHEDPEGECMYSSSLSLTSIPDVGGWSTPRPGHFTPGKDAVPIVWEVGWAQRHVWKYAENLAPNSDSIPDTQLAAYRQATRNSYREWRYHMLHVHNYVLLKMSTWCSKHVEENSILWINNNQCIKLVINV